MYIQKLDRVAILVENPPCANFFFFKSTHWQNHTLNSFLLIIDSYFQKKKKLYLTLYYMLAISHAENAFITHF